MKPSTSAAADPKLADTWEDEGHLFCGSHRPIECLRCGIKHSKWRDGRPCPSNKDGIWTQEGIEYIYTSFREADDWEIVRIRNDATEIIEQLRKKAEAQQTDTLSGLRTQIEAELLNWFEDELIMLQSYANDDGDGVWYERIGRLRETVAKKIVHRAEMTLIDSAKAEGKE